jgi:hypothetical protein
MPKSIGDLREREQVRENSLREITKYLVGASLL